ncbi:tumor necrosis factor receptor superfamily member 18 isoform X1 [Tupaia chinensis]|uniref:tumor necrosis factor receptor superfamily member 18 isoform X1 n=1 Tax=Tupaia chinensis TaxID=246437 RepID=UPI000FFB3476|nr:tumor necrosis factor receptor superfamily member 18 isoform X1 [Tupaia chinensis]
MGALGALCAVVLLCALALGLGQRPVALSCAAGRVLCGKGTDTRCCRSCVPGLRGALERDGDPAQLPRGGLVSCLAGEVCEKCDCICAQPEFHCGDPQCKSCKHHPCSPGQEAQPRGYIKFGFECVDCAAGTFSAGREGHCRPWANCSQFGFLTMFPGNKTHNAVCIPEPLPAGQRGQLAIVLAVVSCILILTAAQLGLHIWQLRRQRVWPQETQLLLEALPPAEDACSCQFPEEERGEQLAEEKGRPGDLWV